MIDMKKALMTIVVAIVIFLMPLLIIYEESKQTNNIIPNNNISNNLSNNLSDNKTIEFAPKVVCEGCHLSGKSSIPQAMTVEPHVNGGNYCLICHKFSHDKHPLNKDVTCEKCHGDKNATIPTAINGHIVCNNCHGYPDPLKPSFGNLITIHRQRDVSCITCHADTCTKCHKEMGTNERWEKRLVHFGTILGRNY